jgi:uncharacterized protein (TIGR03083 family)
MALGQRLHASQWSEPSMCEGWAVEDVFAHLAGDFIRYQAWLREALVGNAQTPFPRSELAADNAILLDGYAGMSGPERLEEFERAANDYLAALELVDPEMPQGNPLGTMTVSEQVAWATVECALHGWDVAAALRMHWPPPASVERLAEVWRVRRPEPLDESLDEWSAILLASGREP